MTHNIALLHSPLFVNEVRTVPVKAPDAPAKKRVDSARLTLHALVRHAAKRNGQRVDANKIAGALQACISGNVLDLSNLTRHDAPAVKACLKKFAQKDWHRLQKVAARDNGKGITHIELDSDLLVSALDALHGLTHLESISVWIPPDGGPLDFGMLKGANGPLRIRILGTPSEPLAITVLDGAIVEGDATFNAAIRNSIVLKRDAHGQVNKQPMPIVLAAPPQVSAPLVEDARSDDVSFALRDLMRCSTFDASGRFGVNLTLLTPEQTNRIQALGDSIWQAMGADARRAGLNIKWLRLPNEIKIDFALMRSLKQISRDITIIAGTPAAKDTAPVDTSLQSALLSPLQEAVEAVMDCASFDESGKCGIDLRLLSPEQVRSVQALGSAVWAAVAAVAKVEGQILYNWHMQATLAAELEGRTISPLNLRTEISWLHLHDDFVISDQMAAGLNKLSSLETLSLATPARGMLVNLQSLLGVKQHSKLSTIEVRCRAGRACAIMAPDGVEVRPSSPAADNDSELMRSKVIFLSVNGAKVREELLFRRLAID